MGVLDKLTDPIEKIAPKDFKRKFSAWWEGDEYCPQTDEASDGDEAEVAEEPKEVPVKVADDVLAMAVAQGIWGAGYLRPGSYEHFCEMAKTLSLTKEKSMAVLGVGLGGPARDIAKFSDVWITGYESLDAAIGECTRQNMMAGLAKKVTVEKYDPNTVELPEKKYNAIASFERFCFIEDKARLIEQCESSLRGGGYLLITDYVKTSDAINDDLVEQMFSPKLEKAHLWSKDQYVEAMSATGMSLRVQDDMTDEHCDLIQAGSAHWTKILGELEKKDASLQAAIFGCVSDDQAQWVKRLEALQNGDLAVFRFLASKASGPV